MRNILKLFTNPFVMLAIGIIGVLLTWTPSDLLFIIGLCLLGYIAIIVVALIVYAWIINPIRNIKKK